ncbi:MAG TPA: hypothetical protein VHS97_23665 [Isosphaeraceae bacterium]|jgi:hypothetical protein|nr:hypothetical protein [Isosphaeraceae bacterium]
MPKAKAFTTEPNDNGHQLDPIVDGLLDRLPAPGDVFMPADRQLWIKIMTDVFQLIYLDKEPETTETDGGAA